MRLLFRLLSFVLIGTFLASCDGLSTPSVVYDPLANAFEGTFVYVGCEGDGAICELNDASWADSSIVIEKFEGEVTMEDVLPGLGANQLFAGDDYVDHSSEGRISDYYVITVIGPDIGGPYYYKSIMGDLVFYLYGYEGKDPFDSAVRMNFLERKFTKERRVDLMLPYPYSDSRLVFMPKG